MTNNSPPFLVVRQTLPEQVAPGQSIVADITVTNTGGRMADAVMLSGWWTTGYELSQETVASQSINGKRSWGMGSIAAGESRTVRVKLIPAANMPAATEFRSGFDATFSSAVTDTRSVKLLKPELHASVVCPESSMVGQTVTLQVKVKNPSSVMVNNINVVVRLPMNLYHASGRNELETQITSLAAGATETIPLDVMTSKPGEVCTKVRVTGTNTDPVEHQAKFQSIEPKLAVSLNGPKTLFQNWPATFEAVIENQGDTPLKMAGLEMKLPAGFKDLRATGKPLYDAAHHRLLWTLDTLQPGEKRTLVWFGIANQTEDLVNVGTVTVGTMPIKRAEWVTKNAGPESK